MKIGFVSSEKYPKTIHRLADTEFPYIDILYLTYEDYTKVPQILEERQLECDAILFSGYLAYYYSRATAESPVDGGAVSEFVAGQRAAHRARTGIRHPFPLHLQPAGVRFSERLPGNRH